MSEEIHHKSATEGCSRKSPAQHDSTSSPSISQGVDEIFPLFRAYVENRLEQKGEELEGKQKTITRRKKLCNFLLV